MHWNKHNILKLKKIGGIYIFSNKICGKVYIGQTIDFYMRYFTHISRKEKTIFSKSLHKYMEDFQFGILEVVKCKKEMNKREEFWIEYYKSYKRKNGYNQGKYSHAFKRKKFTNDHKNKISVSLTGIKRSTETVKKGINTRIKIGSKNASILIQQLDITNLNIISTFNSINEAYKITGVPRRSISYSIETFNNRKYKDRKFPKAGNFYWNVIKPTI